MSRFIFITGGVSSSLGKGVTSASMGNLLESMGHRVAFLKLDPYLNIDPGTMSPNEHGEVFVTHDGAETDLDLGHYERFTRVTLKRHHNVTAGQLYARLLEKERRGDFLGGTIQIVPHLTDEIKHAIHHVAQDADITLVEIGGTVGDIEGLPFIEAIRHMGLEKSHTCVYVHVTYLPYIQVAEELKTKPTQHSVKELRSLGIQPDILVCRAQSIVSPELKEKIALFTNVPPEHIISAPDLHSIYDMPLHLHHEGLADRLIELCGLPPTAPNLAPWRTLTHALANTTRTVRVALIGKYQASRDTYKSIYEACIHAQAATDTRVQIVPIDAQQLTDQTAHELLHDVDAILVPGGFGTRGIEGKIVAAQYARTQRIPYLGICLGMQIAVVEFARNVAQLANAHSTECDPHTPHPVVDLLHDQHQVTRKGGTMRLGGQPCTLTPGSHAAQVYGATAIVERHRHRYEVNTAYQQLLQEHGMVLSGMHPELQLPEMIEIPDHPYFIGCQFHPELQSTPYRPHPLFVSLVHAAASRLPL